MPILGGGLLSTVDCIGWNDNDDGDDLRDFASNVWWFTRHTFTRIEHSSDDNIVSIANKFNSQTASAVNVNTICLKFRPRLQCTLLGYETYCGSCFWEFKRQSRRSHCVDDTFIYMCNQIYMSHVNNWIYARNHCSWDNGIFIGLCSRNPLLGRDQYLARGYMRLWW